MLKKARLLIRPPLAVISPAHPESAKTASSPWDAPFRGQGRSERPKMILPSLLAFLSWNGTRVGPTAAVERGYRCSLQARSFSLMDGG
jgi:hypothetical protein